VRAALAVAATLDSVAMAPTGTVVSSSDPWVDRDWFDNPIRPDGGLPFDPVPCPACGEGHTTRAAMERHLTEVHGRRPPRPGRPPRLGRLRAWVRGLGHLPLWFVLPVNVLLTAILVAWTGGGWNLVVFTAEGDQLPVIKTWLVRLSLLPTVLLLAFRQVDRRT
jgi:hypothetical protein